MTATLESIKAEAEAPPGLVAQWAATSPRARAFGGPVVSPTYYPIQRKWRQLRPVFEQPHIIELMHEQMEIWASIRAEESFCEHTPRPLTPWLRPADYDSGNWRRRLGRRGRLPDYFEWAAEGACHWLASTYLFVISEVEPDQPWQIATSTEHSTVVDLERKLIFDPNVMAQGSGPEACWKEAVEHHSSELLPVGTYMNHQPLEANG
jgi:hypothetical protein